MQATKIHNFIKYLPIFEILSIAHTGSSLLSPTVHSNSTAVVYCRLTAECVNEIIIKISRPNKNFFNSPSRFMAAQVRSRSTLDKVVGKTCWITFSRPLRQCRPLRRRSVLRFISKTTNITTTSTGRRSSSIRLLPNSLKSVTVAC